MPGRRLPTLFVSHGSPMLAIQGSPARRFLAALGPALPRPRAIVVASAHHDAATVEVTGAERPRTIHDFGGFPDELYRLRYAAPGDPALAQEIVERLTAHALEAHVESHRGLDHGAWIPLGLMFPDADIPVVQVSIDSERGPAHHVALGHALRELRDSGVLLLASGGATHNLALYFRGGPRSDDAVPEPVRAFNEWTASAVESRRIEPLERYLELAPHAAWNHPTPEHFLPLFVALGASLDEEPGVRIHSSYDRGLLSMDAYAFGFDAWRGAVFPAATLPAAD